MDDDLESWLITVGDDVLRKMSSAGRGSLTDVETAIYHLWVVDYAVRNSGTLGPMEELCPEAASRLLSFSLTPQLRALAGWLARTSPEQDVLVEYLERFPAACLELQRLVART